MTKARAHPGWMCPKPFSVANTTKRWCTRSWSPTRPTHARPERPWAGPAFDQEAVQAKGHGQCARRHDLLAAVAWGWPDFSEHAGRELHAQDQQEDVPRRHVGDLLAVGPRRPSGGGRIDQARLAQDPGPGRQVQGDEPA